MTKVNCYDCVYRLKVAGSAHSQCNHPSLKKITDNPMLQLMGVFASVGRVPPMSIASKELNIKADQHGIRKGWFNFPFNYDPIWLDNCDGFKQKERQKI